MRYSLEHSESYIESNLVGFDNILEGCRHNQPVALMDFIGTIESALGKTAQKDFQPLQAGDVPATWADIEDLVEHTGFKPTTPIQTGISSFIGWYRKYYGV